MLHSFRARGYCVEHDVVNGYDDGLYHPIDPLTRDQMAVFIARSFDLPPREVNRTLTDYCT